MSEHEFIEHLKKDHDKQKELGQQLVDAETENERERLRQEFYDALYPHMIGEEASIFSRLRASDNEEAREDCLECLQEHHAGKILLRELMDISTDSAIFRAKAKVLDEMNRHHIEEEEGAIFKHLKRMFSDGELDKLFKQYEEAEEDVEE